MRLMGLPELIKSIRKDLGLNQDELGKIVGRDQGTVSKWERGKLAVDFRSAEKLAELTGLPISRFSQSAATEADAKLGNRIKYARETAGLTAAGLAGQLDTLEQTIDDWESGFPIPRDKLTKLADALEVSAHWILTGRGEPDQSARESGLSIPVIDYIAAGAWGDVNDAYPAGEGERYIYTERNHGVRSFALEIQGRSMEPQFLEGDVIIIDPEIEAQPGDFVVAKRENDETATFKKFVHKGFDDQGEPIISLESLNPVHPDLAMDSRFPGRIVGPMVEHRHYTRPQSS